MHGFLRLLQITLLISCFGIVRVGASLATEILSKRTVLFFGDSLTAAYGLDVSQGYPALVKSKIEQAGLDWDVAVGAVSGDTSAGGLSRINWMLQRKIDLFVLALGANDGLRGTDTEATFANLQEIIDRVRAEYPNAQIVVAGMMMPPSHGKAYQEEFAAIFPKLAEENDAVLIPFLLDGVAGERSLNLPDGIHPTAEGQEVLAENVWRVIEPLL